ncbi:MAG TPA: AAA family ATPase [Nanoarchaeota archaeon]|nr:AAA family ATPase [Nanoarchaeota archaeon]
MLIKKVVLENIRSYLHEDIEFPAGSTLLSGNIGSGKSTVLMAIEFALFGLRRGELTGASLLRNGAGKGSVMLELEIEGRNVKIGRALKKSSSGVAQDAGFLEVNGEKKSLTAVELKQKVLELLNYPQETLSKNDMLFRHTVYVSQEEMKQILLGDKESRLNALRYVFGIDRFKRISENAKLVSTKAGEKKRELAGYTADLGLKKDEDAKKKEELSLLKQGISLLLPSIGKSNDELAQKKENIMKIEAEIKKAAEIKAKTALAEQKHRMTDFQNRRDVLELGRIEEKLKAETAKPSGNDFAAIINSKKLELKRMESGMNEAVARMHALKADKKHSEDLKKKILELDSCPACMQKVEAGHKERIKGDEDKKLEAIEKELGMHARTESELKDAASRLNNEIDRIREEEKKEMLLKARLKELEDAQKQKDALQARVKENEALLKQLAEEKETLSAELKEYAEKEKEHLAAKEDMEKAVKSLKELEVQKAGFEAKINMLSRMLGELALELAKKEAKKQELEKIGELRQWIDEYFMSLTAEMEKAVMARAHSDFSAFLEKWFSMLVDNEAMAIRLDPEFTPVIEQNGYETDYSFLSGGEKTAAALAYRLALNQVINNMMSEIKTREIIILDEPTDGFSEEQLEKMKPVLAELNTAQTIIVSHEQKIESFVQNVIRFEKEGHVSKVASGR